MSDFEEKYMDVLQNIEFAIASIFRQQPDLTDFEVGEAINALVRQYKAEQRGRTAASPKLTPLGQQVYQAVGAMCQLRLGREGMVAQKDQSELMHPASLRVDEIIACLQRIRKSIRLWTKQGGRQGYLEFVEPFVR